MLFCTLYYVHYVHIYIKEVIKILVEMKISRQVSGVGVIVKFDHHNLITKLNYCRYCGQEENGGSIEVNGSPSWIRRCTDASLALVA